MKIRYRTIMVSMKNTCRVEYTAIRDDEESVQLKHPDVWILGSIKFSTHCFHVHGLLDYIFIGRDACTSM